MSAALQWALALNLSESILEPQEKKEREIEEGNSKKKKIKKKKGGEGFIAYWDKERYSPFSIQTN